MFHGWSPTATRRLYLARLAWENGAPVVKGLGREPHGKP
jgi:hypothetical protein